MLKSIFVDYNPVALLFNQIVQKVSLVSSLADHIKSLLFNKQDAQLQKILFLFGIATLTFKSFNFVRKTVQSLNWIPPHIINNKRLNAVNLKKKYGDCYVCITGFTDGIGRAFAQIFAEFGFNLVLIGRNKENVERIVVDLKDIYKNIKIEHIVVDLAKLKEIDQLEDHIRRLANLDIGILINNAGSVAGGTYLSINPQNLVDDINIDLWAVMVLNRILIPHLRARNNRSAIMNVSSCTGRYLSPRVGVYSSAKKSIDIYSRILRLENNDKIDVISVRPFGVTTKMMKMKKGPLMITPRECALTSLADMLAGHDITFSHFKHKVSSLMFYYRTQEERFQLYKEGWKKAREQAQQ